MNCLIEFLNLILRLKKSIENSSDDF